MRLCATTAQAAYSRFARVSLAALDNEQVSIPRDPEVEADIVNSDPAAHEAVRKELHRVCNEMAKAYRDESTKDGSFHDRMDEIKHQVKLKLVARHGLQRCEIAVNHASASLLLAINWLP